MVVGILALALQAKAQDFWEQLSFPDTINIANLVVNNQGHIFVGTVSSNNDGIFRSIDHGQTWAQVLNTTNFQIYSIGIIDSGYLYVSTNGVNNFFASYDNSDSWQPLPYPLIAGAGSIFCIGVDTLLVASGTGNGDHRWGENFEVECTQTNVPIVNNGETTLSIEYHLLPYELPIAQDLIVSSNPVARFTPAVINGAKLTITNAAQIDMYNSEIHIGQGSNLILDNNTKNIAKRGICKIVIDGSISVGNGVTFESEDAAELELLINNPTLPVILKGLFINCKLSSYAASFFRYLLIQFVYEWYESGYKKNEHSEIIVS